MAVYAVFASATKLDGMELDKVLRVLFSNVYRVGQEFWLIDTARGADEIYTLMRPVLTPADKLFIAGITRDFFPLLSAAALTWLTAPGRSWATRRVPTGEAAARPGFAEPAARSAVAA